MATSDNSTTSTDLTKQAYTFASPEEYTAWLDDPTNYVKRTVKGETTMVRRTPSVSANVPDDIHWQMVQRAAGDKARLDDGDMTYAVREAVWQYLGLGEQYPAWAQAEKERIAAERSDRMSGAGAARAERVKAIESENAGLKSELESLKAQLEKFMASNKS